MAIVAGTKLARGRITIIKVDDGADVVKIYTRSQFQPSTPVGNSPMGWNATASTFDSSYWTLWVSSAVKNADGTFAVGWSKPIPAEVYDSNAFSRFPFIEGTGAQSPFTPYSSTDNIREKGQNPFGVNDVLWRGKSQISTGWCGGFSLESNRYIPVDNSKMYRFACWFKRNTWSEGNLYFGVQGTVQANTTWTDNTNFYFWNTGTTTLLQVDKWYLVVGYIYPSTHSDTATDIRAGVYDPVSGNKIIASSTTAFCRQKAGVSTLGFRISQYNCSTTNPEVHFWQPRVDLCDGREPSIEELIKKNPILPTITVSGETVFKFAPGQSVPSKTAISFSATLANGLITYQWQYSNGGAWTNISGATSATYSLTYNYSAWGANSSIRLRCISTLAGAIYNSNEVTITKIYDGAIGPPGIDANLLDWVSDWDSAKTVIGATSVITPKIFAGVKNANNTVTGVALGRFAMSTRNDAGTIITETIDGVYGFRDGYKTFFIDSGGNAGLGRGNQSIKYNAVTGRIEFGSEVAMAWAGATYIDANGIFTGTLSANTVNAININASQITAGTIGADKIDVNALQATLITAGNINALTLSVTKGTIGGWSIDSDSIFRGTKNNTSGAYTAASGAMTIGSNGIRGFKWRLDSTGAGAVAGGNIAWDASGNVTFASTVALAWNTPITAINTALGGASFPKMTHISSTGIYTGTLSAEQINAGTISADRIATGSITASKLDATSIKADIINVGYINGLSCAFTKGTIGGWTINSSSLSSSQIVLDNANKRIGVYGASSSLTSGQRTMLYYNSNSDFGFYSTDSSGSVVVRLGSANQIAGWNITLTQISKNSVVLGADGSITNGTKWKLNNDGSGQIAAGNITWNAAGAVTFSSAVSMNWTAAINEVQTNLTIATDNAMTTTIDLTSSTYDQSTYYPVVLALGVSKRSNILLYNTLGSSSKPSWATHSQGFSCECEWESIGSGWGTRAVVRTILRSTYSHTTVIPFGDISQMTNSSFEVIYLRGGGIYFFKTTNVSSVEVKSTSFTNYSQTVDPKASVTQPTPDLTLIHNALGGTTFPKLTHITSTGVYTGSLTATQVNAVAISANSITTGVLSADRIAAGSIGAIKLDAASIKSTIINTDYINGLSCTFTKGSIGGFTIGSDNMSVGALGGFGQTPIQIRTTSSGSGAIYSGAFKPYGITITWHQTNNAGHLTIGQIAASASSIKSGFMGIQMMSHDSKEYFCLSANTATSTSQEVYNRIAGWAFDNQSIWKNSVYLGSDGSIYNGQKWRMNNDGSGRIANGNIVWDAAGNVTFSSSVSLNWTNLINQGKIYALGSGLNRSSYRVVALNGSNIVYNGARGLTLTVINRNTLEHISSTNYDVYGSEANCNSMATALNALNSDRIVVITSFDAIRINATLNTAIQRCGGSDYTVSDDRIPYAMIGIPTIGKSNGLLSIFSSAATDPYAEISTEVQNGIPLGVNARGRLYTYISGTGIYTGTINADQITAGTIDASRINTESIKTAILTATNINALTLTTNKGTIGGWSISSNQISKNSVILGSDGSITNGSLWRLNNDGSGQLANGNITWTTSGALTVSAHINANTGSIGGFNIAYDGLTSIDDTGDNYNDAYLIVRRKKTSGGYSGQPLKTGYRESRIGTNVLPATSGTAGLGYFQNTEYQGYYNTITNNRTYSTWSSFLSSYPTWYGNIRNISYSGSGWTDYSGYKKSPTISDNGITTCRFNFYTSSSNQTVNFEIKAFSETNFDFMQIGYIDQTGMTRTSGYYDRVSGNGVSKTVSISVANAGSHYIEFCYAKDGSQSTNGDYGLFRCVNESASWNDFYNSGRISSFPYTYSHYYDSVSNMYILNYITVPEYSYEWVQMPWSVNRGILMDVRNAEENLAIDVYSGSAFFRKGAVVQWSNKYIGQAYTDILESLIGQTNVFVFTSITSSLLNVRMPSSTYINNASSGSSYNVTFEFTIVIAASSNQIQLSSQTGGQMKNNANGNVATLNLGAGDVATFVYANGCYYQKQVRT